jgi:hypothetical protein
VVVKASFAGAAATTVTARQLLWLGGLLASPLYVALKKKAPLVPEAGFTVSNVTGPESGTAPLVTVTVLITVLVPAQISVAGFPLSQYAYVTVPLAVAVCIARVALM